MQLGDYLSQNDFFFFNLNIVAVKAQRLRSSYECKMMCYVPLIEAHGILIMFDLSSDFNTVDHDISLNRLGSRFGTVL